MSDLFEKLKEIAQGNGKTDERERSTQGHRIAELERDVKNLTVAILILLNAKEKRSQAKIPREILNGTARVVIHYEDTEPHCVATIRVQKS